MKATIMPGTPSGAITIPPSKSIAHRAIICASLASGTSTICNLDYSEDILATIDCMKILGAKIEEISSDNERKTLKITGMPILNQDSNRILHCRESGSTLRFLIPLAALSGETTYFTGQNRLLHRPQSVYEELFASQKLTWHHDNAQIRIKGKLQPGHFQVRGDVSSQFISGLLFALPLLEESSVIEVLLPLESKSYIDLTIQTLKTFGVMIKEHLEQDETGKLLSCRYEIPGNQVYQPTEYYVEGDYSQLAFFGVLGAINAPVICLGVMEDSRQGDKAILSFLEKCGAKITAIPEGWQIAPGELRHITCDLADCPDLGPILMVLGLFCQNGITLEHASRLRIKESDRIQAMANGLAAMGGKLRFEEDTVTVIREEGMEEEIIVSGNRDHRIVMSLAIAATKSSVPVTITGAEAVQKSYPSFFQDLQSLGIEVKLDDSEDN